jgi:hypothetical protein
MSSHKFPIKERMAMGETILELQGMIMLNIRPKEEEIRQAGCRHMPVTQN